MDDQAERLRALAKVARARNGRLAIDWLSRRQKPRWRMIALNSQWYDRERLRATLRGRPPPPAVPASRRRLTQAELNGIYDPNPWRLFRNTNAAAAAANGPGTPPRFF